MNGLNKLSQQKIHMTQRHKNVSSFILLLTNYIFFPQASRLTSAMNAVINKLYDVSSLVEKNVCN